MSLKPLKASEIKKNQSKLNAKMNKAKKKIEGILPPYIYIISEGTKTEPNYIAGMVRAINSKYYDFGLYGTIKNWYQIMEESIVERF